MSPGRISSVVLGLTLGLSLSAAAQDFKVLHRFKGGRGGDGPTQLIQDAQGNLFGVTQDGGNTACNFGCGTVFERTAQGATRVIHVFKPNEGIGPQGPLLDIGGSLYGTTVGQSFTNCTDGNCGTIFRVASGGKLTVLYKFAAGKEGAFPNGGLVSDSAGNFYGTTFFGGGGKGCRVHGEGCGIVFKFAPDGTETVLHAFQGNDEGAHPDGNLLADNLGNLFGTTFNGGSRGCNLKGCGTIFELTRAGAFVTLYAFNGGDDGALPVDGLAADKDDALYGATAEGGDGCGGNGCGTIFKLATDGQESVLHSFTRDEGTPPNGNLVIDDSNTIYGTTSDGALATGCGKTCGTVFQLSPDGQMSVLHTFTSGKDGALPFAGLVMGTDGTLYGTAVAGGDVACHTEFSVSGCGTLFSLPK